MITINTDILIIGSEGAGARAAIEAVEQGVRATIVTKGKMTKCGATVTAGSDLDIDGKSIVEFFGDKYKTDPNDTKEDFFEDIVLEGKLVNNQKLVEVHVDEGPARIKELVDWGMKLIGIQHAPGHRCPRGLLTTGPMIMKALRNRVRKLDDKFELVEDIMVTDLLVKDGCVVGAVGINLLSGDFVIMKAKAVIIATGGAMRIYPYTTAPEELTGDGQSMAYRIGAEIIDIEFVQFLTSTFWYPPITTMSANTLQYQGIWLLNKMGQRFMKNWDPERFELSTRDFLAIGIMNEIIEGRGFKDDRGSYVLLSMAHLPEDLIDHYAATSRFSYMYDKPFFEHLKRRAIPVFSASHFFCGGLKINMDCETNIPGLYAAGEAAGGLNGANRLSGNAITQIVVQGFRAGRAAAKYVKKVNFEEADSDQISYLKEKIYKPLERKNGTDPIKLRRKLQGIAHESATVVRNGGRLEKAIKEMDELKQEASEVCASFKHKVYNREWINCLELENMVQTLDLILHAANKRAESRGVHFRKDFPNMDNKNWLKNIVIENKDGHMDMRTEPIVITTLDPRTLSDEVIKSITAGH